MCCSCRTFAFPRTLDQSADGDGRHGNATSAAPSFAQMFRCVSAKCVCRQRTQLTHIAFRTRTIVYCMCYTQSTCVVRNRTIHYTILAFSRLLTDTIEAYEYGM